MHTSKSVEHEYNSPATPFAAEASPGPWPSTARCGGSQPENVMSNGH